jgi:hypothetical protein
LSTTLIRTKCANSNGAYNCLNPMRRFSHE